MPVKESEPDGTPWHSDSQTAQQEASRRCRGRVHLDLANGVHVRSMILISSVRSSIGDPFEGAGIFTICCVFLGFSLLGRCSLE